MPWNLDRYLQRGISICSRVLKAVTGKRIWWPFPGTWSLFPLLLWNEICGRSGLYHFLYIAAVPKFIRKIKWRRSRPLFVVTLHKDLEGLYTQEAQGVRFDYFDAFILTTATQIPFVENKKIPYSVIGLGVNLDTFHPKAQKKSDEEPRKKNPIRILSVGSHLRDFSILQNLPNELRKKNKDIECIIVDSTLKPADSAQLTGWTILSGISQPELIREYQQATIYLQTQSRIAASNGILEAAASALPCVLSDLPASREYLGDEGAIWVEPHSFSALVEAIEKLANDPPLRMKMGQKAREGASRYSWKIMAAKHEDFYQQLINQNQSI